MEIGLIFQNDSEILRSYNPKQIVCRSTTLDPVCFESGHHCHLSKIAILTRQQLYNAIHNVKIYVAGYPEKFSDFLCSDLHIKWSFPVPWNFFWAYEDMVRCCWYLGQASQNTFFVLDITRFQSVKQDYSKSSFQFVSQCLAFLVWDSSFIFNWFICLRFWIPYLEWHTCNWQLIKTFVSRVLKLKENSNNFVDTRQLGNVFTKLLLDYM